MVPISLEYGRDTMQSDTHKEFNTVLDAQKKISITDNRDDFLIRVFRTIKATALHQKGQMWKYPKPRVMQKGPTVSQGRLDVGRTFLSAPSPPPLHFM